jgi:hypothetical protein
MVEQELDAPTHPHFDPNGWPFVFTLLSMDVVVVFYELVGLKIAAPQAFRDLLRVQILQLRREFATPPEGLFYPTERVLGPVGYAFGETQRNHLVWWAHHIFAWDIQEHRALIMWTDILRHCAGEPESWRELGFRAQLDDAVRREFLKSIDRSPYDQRYLETYAQPLSDWDLHIYAIHLFDDEDDAAPNGPHSYLYQTFMNNQGYHFWDWLLNQLEPSEQAALQRNATAIARRTQGLTYLGELPSPSQLEVGL